MTASNPQQFESLAAYHDFRDRMDTLANEARGLYDNQMMCKAGCSQCCRGDFRISLVEAVSLRLAVENETSEEQRAAIKANLAVDTPDKCPLLVNDICSAYASRPILCRIFGFPISNGEAIATCELNFKDIRDIDLTVRCFDQSIITSVLISLSELCCTEFANAGMPLPSDEELPAFRVQEILEGMSL